MKEKFLWGGIAAIILSWALNYAYFQAQQLDEPIFLEHYYETYIENEGQLTFYYLTNKLNPHEVVSVSIDGLDGVGVYHGENDGFFMWEEQSELKFEQEYSHHYLKAVTLQFHKDILPLNDSRSTFSFERMDVFFDNGSSISAELGKVILHPFDVLEQVAFDVRMSSGSDQHRSEAMVTKEAVVIEDIVIPFGDDLAGQVFVKADIDQERLKELERVMQGGDFPVWADEEMEAEWDRTTAISIDEGLLPLEMGANEWLNIKMFFNPERASYFEFSIKMEGLTASGIPFVHYVPVTDHPNLDQKAIDRIIAGKDGGK
ncbi:hypothetical protein [Bacillus sp. FJAT-27251]|uniref:hypothetical protein n=1 Tax=Bacillus sp. FJAT-27251 TaxID=1684142 RepID=UPI0006A79041|nr:hypothetical protein [Bacillus sp. FJAT-27251]